jgi:hypothetical protein
MIRAVAVLSLILLTAACGGGATPAPPPSSTTSKTSTPTTKAGPPALADLVKDPCAAIAKGDEAGLGAVTEGSAIPSDPETCSWVAPPGIVVFKAFPASDETPGIAAKPGAVAITVSGKPGVQITSGQSCFTYVTVAEGQSFRTGAAGDASDLCGPTVRFAVAVLANLGG